MALTNLLTFENPEVIAIALGVLAFVVVFDVLKKVGNFEKGPAGVIGLVMGMLTSWYFYTGRVVLEGNVLAGLLLVVVVGIMFKIAQAFWKRFR